MLSVIRLVPFLMRAVLRVDPWQYRSTDFVVPGAGKLQLVYSPADGSAPTVLDVYDFKGNGVAMSMYNTDEVYQFERFHSATFHFGCSLVDHRFRTLLV
jgi:isocitrate dehydrogenase